METTAQQIGNISSKGETSNKLLPESAVENVEILHLEDNIQKSSSSRNQLTPTQNLWNLPNAY